MIIKEDRARIGREKFYPGPGLEPGLLDLRASALTTTLSGTSVDTIYPFI